MQFSQQPLYLINFITKTQEIENSEWELKMSTFIVGSIRKLLELGKPAGWNWLEVWVKQDWLEVWVKQDYCWVLCFIPRFLMGNNFPGTELPDRQRRPWFWPEGPLQQHAPSYGTWVHILLCFQADGICAASRVMRANLPLPQTRFSLNVKSV